MKGMMAGESPVLVALGIIKATQENRVKDALYLWNGAEDKDAVMASLALSAVKAVNNLSDILGVDRSVALDRVTAHFVELQATE